MHAIATNRAAVLKLLGTAAGAFLERGGGTLVPGLESISAELGSLLAKELLAAKSWAESADGEAEEADEIDDDDDYVSHDPVISLVQAAVDEHADDTANDDGALTVDLLRVIADTLRHRGKNHLPFIPPQAVTDFTHDLPEQCTVVLVGDWGTAKPRARNVARAIAARAPDHVIHLGDIYPSGTRSRAQKRFIDVWRKEVGDKPKFWAMNGNHEMNANGEGYFLDVLPFCHDSSQQAASLFCLRNDHWKLIALDSSYRDFDLEPSQLPWLDHQISTGSGRNVLLTHHQMFSAVDRRPHRNAKRLPATLAPVVATGKIFGWFWGHEHRFLSYAREPGHGNYHARAIGHGGKRVKHVTGVHLGLEFAPPVLHYWEVLRPEDPDRCLNGFALLTFEGPRLTIEYIDENGNGHYREVWPDQPHGVID